MKILDRYILVTYLKTFFSVFIILMLIFVLQSVWLYITELAGKDLEIDIVAKFLLYVTPRLVVLVLPLTILLASIMVFGSFAENYEFAAMKSTGISLQRAMRTLSVFIVGLAITTFFFANNVIPWAEFNFYNLRKNIAKVKPAMAIAEGQFNQIGSINIKVDKKSGERGQFLEGVIIHQKKGNSPGNHTVIVSKTGELASSVDSDVLKLVLFDGNYHDDLQPKDFKDKEKKPNAKSTFEKYTINVDLSKINEVDFEKQDYTTKYSMLGIKDLNTTIDTLLIIKTDDYKTLAENMYNRTTAASLNTNISPKKNDSVAASEDNIYKLFKPHKNIQLIDIALNSIRSTKQIITTKKKTLAIKEKNINKHIISFYEKFALGFACIILFFIGAPLGALIRKGGFGLPIIIAIVLFLTYHFIGIFAKNSAEDSSLNPVIASWLSTFLMLPLSIYLTNRATKDRSLFDLDSVLVPLKKLLSNKSTITPVYTNVFLDENSEAYSNLNSYSDKKLIDIIKNYRQYDFDDSYRNTSLQILNTRGITEEELRFGGNLVNENYETALRYKNAYSINSVLAFKLYFITLPFSIIGAVLNNNGFPVFGKVLVIIGAIATVLYLIYFIKAFINQSNFYKIMGGKIMTNAIVLIILGVPLYFIYHFYFKSKLKEDLKQIR
ncbi:MAG: LptF/LptG family permease [Flavobacteriaceae bacterium]|nr:LptF/LptG family permease [Flavobacteriaceae bacterium]